MLIPSISAGYRGAVTSLSRRVNANSQLLDNRVSSDAKLIKKGEC